MNVIFRFMTATQLELVICMLIDFKAERDSPTDFEIISLTVAILVTILYFMYVGLLFTLAVMDSDT